MNLPSLPRTERTFKSGFWPTVIRYRAFTAGQQSLLLQVSDSNTPQKERIDAMDQLFTESVEAGVPFSRLPIGVVEEVFIKMRSASIGEQMKIRFACKMDYIPATDGSAQPEVCNQEMVVPVPLDKVLCTAAEGFKDVFDLPGGYHLKMRIPSFSDLMLMTDSKVESLIATFIDCLYDDDGQVWNIENPDEPGINPNVAEERRRVKDEFTKWVADNIENDVISDISENFFNKVPRVHYETKIKCPKCGNSHDIKFNGINEIFI